MTQHPRPARRWPLAATALALALALALIAAGRPARAQEDDDVVEDAAPPQGPQMQMAFMINEQVFDQWVFGNVRTAEAGRSKFEALLALRVDDLDRACGLTDAQERKLRLAGRGDLARFFDRVEEMRARFKAVQNDQNKAIAIHQELQPLRNDVNAGLFGDDSLFAKTVRRTLTPEQVSKYEGDRRDKMRLRHRARIDQVVAMLGHSLGLSADQRRRFVAVLAEETRPPRRSTQYDSQVVLYQAAGLPESKLRPIFDDAQWRALQPQLNMAKQRRALLQAQGALPEGDDDLPMGKRNNSRQ